MHRVHTAFVEGRQNQSSEKGLSFQMFWETFADDVAVSGVTAVLNRPSFSLEDVLREDDVLQEFATSNPLVSFVAAHVRDALRHALAVPKTDEEARFGFFCTELLRFGHASVSDVLLAAPAAEQLLGFLDSPPPLHAVPAEHFSKIVVALLEGRKLPPQRLPPEPLLRHLGNASILNVLLALVHACTGEFETVKGANCRLARFLAPEHAEWLASRRVPAGLCWALLTPEAAERTHALEVLEKMVSLVQPGDAVAAQLSSPQVTTEVFGAPGAAAGGGSAAERVQAAEAAALLQSRCSVVLEDFALQFGQRSLAEGSKRCVMAAARLVKSRVSPALLPLLPPLVDFILAHERATLVAIAVTDCVSSFLVDATLRQQTHDLVFSKLVGAFVAEPQQLMGVLVALLDQHKELIADAAVRDKVGQCVALQHKPLFGARDPDRYIAKLDLKGGDIDGLKM